MTAQPEFVLDIDTPEWSVPLLDHYRYKGAKGGRSSGKSHERAESMVEALIMNADAQAVCVREIQKSLKYSAKKLIEAKIKKMKVSHLFDITLTEIRRKGGEGLIIFIGMQDHTADSIKSLEGFDIVWCEEAQNLSKRSIELLTPTFRKDTCELWFTWNPENEDDAIEQLFRDLLDMDSIEGVGGRSANAILVHVNYDDNPWCPNVMQEEAETRKVRDYESYAHIWLGMYNTKSEAQIFAGHFRIDEFEPKDDWHGPYYGMDFGFSSDPTCFVRCWIGHNTLYIDQDAGDVGIELDAMSTYFQKHDPDILRHTTRADSARPESISYLRRHGLPRIEGVKKWPGSVEDGVSYLNSFDEIVIHVRCTHMAEEARMYKYKVDKKSGDVLTDIVDAFNHRWDAVRYALQPMIKKLNVIFEAM